MTPDGKLLGRYAKSNSEAAFAELVRRHADLVYSAALRQVGGDTHLAQDVAQTVFTDLARKAAALTQRESLAGWLYTSTHFAAAKAVRTECRRRTREQEAHTMNELLRSAAPDSEWDQLRPALDSVMMELQQPDRDAILLRYFESRQLAEIGQHLGLSEDAARKRVDRALEKLRVLLSQRGITTAGTLATLLSVNAVHAAPAALVATLSSIALAGATGSAGTTVAVFEIMGISKLQLGIGAAVAVAVTTALMIQHQSRITLQNENAFLRLQIAQLNSDNENLSRRMARTRPRVPQLPAPPMQSTISSTEPAADALQSTNLYARFKDKQLKLTAGQVEPYLKSNGRNAASLLAAYRTTGERSFLEEAMQTFPNNPQVAFEATFKEDAPPEDRRRWLDSFKQQDPENAIVNYLSAREYFKAGQTDLAVQEFLAATGKSFRDYTSERYQDDTEAYLAAGYSVADSKTASSMYLLLPQLAHVKEAGLDMIELAKSYRQVGDGASAQAALQLAMELGQRYSKPSPGEAEISQLVGMAIERAALRAMEPADAYGSDGQTVQARLNQLTQQTAELNELNRRLEPIFQQMSDHDWISYKDRWLMFGEENAARWLVNKYGQE